MSTHRPELRLRLDPEAHLMLEERAAEAGLKAATHGRTGGAAEYVRRLVMDHLGLPCEDPHEVQMREWRARRAKKS